MKEDVEQQRVERTSSMLKFPWLEVDDVTLVVVAIR